jgi:NAD(P)-dependent dehydrogenase (short-subunit alcohol dehydrogenase family)
MSLELQGRVAVVTGGTRGIGRAVAESLLGAGAAVAISGRSEDKGKAAIEEMGGERLFFQSGDARLKADVESFIDAAADALGPIDILVNNAGGSSGFALIGDLSDDAWQEAADWILNSTFWATRRVLPGMKERGWGRIIQISSLESKFLKTPMAGHYSTFKAAVNMFSRAVAVEYGSFGITSNSICPGAVETDLMKSAGLDNAEASGMSYEQFLDHYASQTLTGKINTVEEVAAVALLLASQAGAGITGTAINVDGGTSPW